MKKQLYLSADYETLIKNNGYYVDKTHFIPVLERFSNPIVFFLRPRRFGKSLLLSMLEHYYGIQYKDQFDSLFGDYFIGQQDSFTPLKNSYYILNFNFSGIKTDETELIEREFNAEIYTSILKFLNTYKIGSKQDKNYLRTMNSGTELLRNFFTIFNDVKPSGKIYILIDEYDHFTNELFAFNPNHFKEIVSQNGWVRKFYEVIKQFAGEGVVDRFFATGVTPVTLDSMTSGFNIAKNITLVEQFHNIAGFTEGEVVDLIKGIFDVGFKFDLDNLIGDIRNWYNGSKFSANAENKLYNPQMLLNFLDYFYLNNKYPVDMYDPSVSSDYSKIKKQLGILKAEESYNIITEIIEKERIRDELTQQFNFEISLERKDLISLLFYNGLLTIDSGEGKIITFVIPNYVSKIMYWEFIRKQMVEDNVARLSFVELMPILDEMRFDGEVNKLIEYTSEIINILSNRDLRRFRELNLKSILVTILSFSQIYRINSEIEINRKYIDLLLELQPEYKGKYSFLLELKYVKQTEGDQYEGCKKDGIDQLQKYIKLKNLKKIKNLKAYLILFLNDKGEAVLIQ